MPRIWAIALHTFREAVRDRVLHAVLGAAIAMLFFTLALAELSLHEEERVVTDLGIATISLFSVVIALFLGSSLLYKEIERKTLYVVLPKPIHRHQFLLGKYGGITLTAAVFVATMGAIELLVAALQRGRDPAWTGALAIAEAAALAVLLWKVRDRSLAFATWSVLAILTSSATAHHAGVDLSVFFSYLGLTIGEVILLTAVAMFFSSFSTPFVTGALTAGVWLIGRGAGEMATTRSSILPESVRAFLHGLSWVVPNFHLFVPTRHALTDTAAATYVAHAVGYSLLYAALMLTVACLVFRRREFV